MACRVPSTQLLEAVRRGGVQSSSCADEVLGEGGGLASPAAAAQRATDGLAQAADLVLSVLAVLVGLAAGRKLAHDLDARLGGPSLEVARARHRIAQLDPAYGALAC